MSRGDRPRRRPALAAAALVLPVAWPASATDLAACRAVADDRARLACYDALAAAAPGAGAPPPKAAAAPPPPTAVDLFGRDSGTAAAELGMAAGVVPLDELRATLAAVDRAPDGRLLLTLDNGQAWSQVDTRRALLRTGDAVVIRPGAFGSFLLSTGRGQAAVRVRRDH